NIDTLKCVVRKVLQGQVLRPSRSCRHLNSKHPGCVEKSKEYFLRKKDGLQAQQKVITSLSTQSKVTLKASYMVAAHVARSKKAFTIAKELILPSAVDRCRELLGDAAATKIQSIPLSDDTVARRNVDMSDDIECQLVERIKASPYFAIQLDESTDISKVTLLLVFVRYCTDSNLCEDLLFCKELPTRTAADNVMHCLDEYFTEKGLDWKYCSGICTDDAAAMTGKHHGVWKILQQSRSMCERLDADHLQLLYHSKIRWLSRGCVLNRLFELRKEVHTFLEEQRSPLAEHYNDDQFCAKLAYLSDIFDQLNQLNVSMQGRNSTVFLVSDKIEGFKKKLILWNRRVKEGRFDMFPHLSETLEASSHVNISSVITQHLSQLSQKFADYFPEDPRHGNLWILDPFSVNPASEDMALSTVLENELMELSADSSLKLQLTQVDLASFWLLAASEYPSLSKRANTFILPFTTTYLCESGFSTVTITKSKARSKLKATLDATLRVSLSPRLDLIISKKQAQVSH
uniref:HAT C-terminal dimerisation domain-containing protein n=1 Tax=Sinocyclocheilus rhinocerous TaxID=307959 RepID=A0A673KQ08_9TELE